MFEFLVKSYPTTKWMNYVTMFSPSQVAGQSDCIPTSRCKQHVCAHGHWWPYDVCLLYVHKDVNYFCCLLLWHLIAVLWGLAAGPISFRSCLGSLSIFIGIQDYSSGSWSIPSVYCMSCRWSLVSEVLVIVNNSWTLRVLCGSRGSLATRASLAAFKTAAGLSLFSCSGASPQGIFFSTFPDQTPGSSSIRHEDSGQDGVT